MHTRHALRGALTLVGATALGFGLTACGSGGSGGGTGDAAHANLVMSIWGSDNDTHTYQQRADAYTATHPGVRVTVRNIPVDNYDQQIDTMISGGSSPDIILVDGSRAPSLASRGAIADLDPLITSSSLTLTDVVDAGRLTGYQLDGKQYALPDRGGNIVFYYNKKMFDAAGVAYPTPGWTWDQMVDAAQRLTIRQGDKTTQWGIAVDDWPNAVQSVTASFGGSMFNDDLTSSAIESPEYKEALQKYGDLSLTLKVSPTLQDYANFGQNVNRDALFAQGKTAMIWAGVWDVPDFVKQGLDFGIAAPPIAKSGAPTMEAFGTGLAVGAHSKNQAAAWDVVRYMFSAEGQKPIVTNQEDVPSAKALLPDWEANLPTGVSYDDVVAASDLVFSPPSPPQITEIQSQVQKDLYPYFAGKSSVDAVTKTAATHINQTLGSK